jgi:nucleotide-binding universal stress UspA family protein
MRTTHLIVVGGHSRVFHAVLGTVADSSVRNATSPVLIIPSARSASGTLIPAVSSA